MSSAFTRREALQATGAAAVTALAGGIGTFTGTQVMADDAADNDLRAGYIDAHSHIWTRDVARYPLADNQSLDVLDPPSFTIEELLATCRPLGVTRVVLIQHKPHHGLDNSYIVDAIAENPGVFVAVACVEAEADDPTIAMADLKAKGATGFRIRPGEGGHDDWRDSPGMRAMWEFAGEENLAICPLINPEHLPMVGAMCELYPDTNVVIDHFARIGVDGTINPHDLDTICGLAAHAKVNVKCSAYYALGKKEPPHEELLPMIRRVYEAYGPRRIMWASDSPYQIVPPNTYAASLALARDGLDFMSDEDRAWFLRGTAERVYFRD